MINLGLGLGINVKQSLIWKQLNADCCTANGVTCVGQLVTQIDWKSRNLNGAINGSALPSGLQIIYLHMNQLTGTIPSTWPSGLKELYLYDNQLTGSIPISWPSGLQRIDLDVNQLTGLIPSTFPSALQQLYLHYNQLTGLIPISWPSGLQFLAFYNNYLTGDISSTWPTGLQYLHLSNNFLTGDISSLPSTMQYLYLGFPGDTKLNHFTGKLILNKPQYLYINDNWITDVIVYDPSLLTGRCDLSNNPLLGNPQISNLAMCIRSGLYDAKLLPYTMSSSLVATNILITKASFLTKTSSGAVKNSPLAKNSSLPNTMPSDVLATATSLMIKTRAKLQSTTETDLLLKSYVSISIHTSRVVKEQVFIFVGQESLWRLSWTVMVKLLINAMTLTGVFFKGPFKRELKAIFGSKKKQTTESFDIYQ